MGKRLEEEEKKKRVILAPTAASPEAAGSQKYPFFPIISDNSYLILVGTGSDLGNEQSACQVVDIFPWSTTKSCQNLTEYPMNITYSTGGVLSEMPVICGGRASFFIRVLMKLEMYNFP